MGYKMKGSPAKLGTIQGTAGHASALKYRKNTPAPSAPPKVGNSKMSDADWKKGQEKAKSKGDNLDALVKQREGQKKGSDEYNVTQNKINRALGDKTRHGVTETGNMSEQRKHGGGVTSTKTTPGIATTVTNKKRGAGSILGGKVTKETKYDDGTTVTSKFKASKKGGATVSGVEGVRKAKTTTSRDETPGRKGVDEKLKTKYNKSGEITKQKNTVKEDDKVTKTITKGTGDDVTKRVKTRKRGGTGLGSKIKGIFKKKDKKIT
jgi:hypothetical protein